MEDKRFDETTELTKENIDEASGGIGGYSGGYCPYTTDRSCRIEAVGNFDPNNEICQDCGWRAW